MSNGVRRVLSGIALGAVIALAACTSSKPPSAMQPKDAAVATPYQSRWDTKPVFGYGYGYEESSAIWSSSHTVTVVTNKFTGIEQTRDMALFRSAEIGRETGHNKFRLTNVLAAKSCGSQFVPGTNTVTFTVHYGKGDEEVGGDSQWTEITNARLEQSYRGASFHKIDKVYEVDSVLSELTAKVNEVGVSGEVAEANGAEFDRGCR